MDHISLGDSTWHTTFPCIVAPLENESIIGLLLRCDEVNQWESGLSLTYLINSAKKAKLRRSVYFLTELQLQKLARALALPLASIVATTYHTELSRLYERIETATCLVQSPEPFHLCSACVAERRLLQRAFMLPGITHCPQHRTMLVSHCQCGEPLQPFSPSVQPFVCHSCGLDWKELSPLPAKPKLVEVECLYLAFYAAFLKGSPEILANALRILASSRPARKASDVDLVAVPPLGLIVRALVEQGYSPDSLNAREGGY